MLGMKLHVFTWLFFAVQRELSAVLRVRGTENEQLNITCSHSWATTNVKYFCTLECTGKDVLIRSVGTGRTAKKGRYSLYDRGPQFTVSIERLMKSDEGHYWCGVERFGVDTYQEVRLKVLHDHQVTVAPQTQTLLLTAFGPGESVPENRTVLISVKARHNYVPVCVCGLLIIMILPLALHYNQVKTCSVLTECLSESTTHTPPRDPGHYTVNKSSSGDQNTNAIIPVYVNLEPSFSQSNPAYQTLQVKAVQLDSIYETLVSSTDQSNQQGEKARQGDVPNQNKPVK